MDYFLSRPIFSYPSTINLMYYYTKVLLSRNYFYNHNLEMLWKKVWPKVNPPKVVTHLATRCLYQGVWVGVGGTSDQRSACQSSTKIGHEMSLPGGTSNHRSTWPEVVPNLAMRCPFWGVHLTKGHPAQSSTKLGQKKSLLGGHLSKGQPASDQRPAWPK